MHMADALVAPAVAAAMYAASGAAAGISIKTLRKDDSTQKLPTMAVTAALVFAGQMINYTIPGTGSSGHGGDPDDPEPVLRRWRAACAGGKLLEYGVLWLLCGVLRSLAANSAQQTVLRHGGKGGGTDEDHFGVHPGLCPDPAVRRFLRCP